MRLILWKTYVIMDAIPPAIQVHDLRFGYQARQPILPSLSLRVPQGAIYGFLGANGAGKSTTIRNLLGLLHPQAGSIRLFGKTLPAHRREVLGRVGALIEAPSCYGHLSGYDNLLVAARYLGIDPARIGEVLTLVGLREHAHKRARHYSTGMRQRLGLAMALLPDPELLILDEPTNGLDPSGIIEIRETLLALNAQGKTIFLSSHLLSEVERIATRVGILRAGELVFEGSIAELNAVRGQALKVRVVTSDPRRAAEVLGAHLSVEKAEADGLIVTLPDRGQLSRIAQLLTGQGIDLQELQPLRHDLEQLFIDLTTA